MEGIQTKMTRVTIMAAGKGTRWGDHLGTKKHFIEIEGEKILNRTVRLIKEYDPAINVNILGPDETYKIAGANLVIADPSKEDKFTSSMDCWSTTERNIIIWGDVWFSEEAMKTILGDEEKDWRLFARFDRSVMNGKVYGECFAISFYPNDADLFAQHIKRVQEAYNGGKGELMQDGGWAIYSSILGYELKDRPKRRINYILINIDDFTDDFDKPEDLETWLEARKNYYDMTLTEKDTPFLLTNEIWSMFQRSGESLMTFFAVIEFIKCDMYNLLTKIKKKKEVNYNEK